MSHFAEVKNGTVTQVIVAEQDFIDTLPNASEWIQTSYNTFGGVHYNPETGEPDDGIALRKNYAGVGSLYDETVDAFYDPQPFSSWLLNEDTYLWESPIAYPEDGQRYAWNEDTISWDLVEETNNE